MQVRTLSETVRLDARTKLLNPKFYEGMLASGYEGTREITKRLRNTMGWSATAGAVATPVSTPSGESVSPGGNAPATDHTYAGAPPTVMSGCSTFLPTNAGGTARVITASVTVGSTTNIEVESEALRLPLRTVNRTGN